MYWEIVNPSIDINEWSQKKNRLDKQHARMDREMNAVF
jgi:hypothetical protein